MHSNHTTKPSCCSASRGSIAKEDTVNQQATLKNTDGIKFKEKMVYLSGGEFLMGTEDRDGFSADNEGPIRKVNVKPFYIDKTSVSNREFKQFIDETGYMTDAEKYGWSFVFYKFLSEEQQRKFQQPQGTPWWFAVEKAYWYQPRARVRVSRIEWIIRSFMYLGMMRKLFVIGLGSDCQQRRNGNLRLEADLNRRNMFGETNCIQTGSIIVIFGRETSRVPIQRRMVISEPRR